MDDRILKDQVSKRKAETFDVLFRDKNLNITP